MTARASALLASGTLLEEASLRRLMSLHAAMGNGKEFGQMAKQYARRFLKSPYRKQYLKMLRKGVFAMRRSMSLEDVGELAGLMPPEFAASLHMHLVRGALESGHLKLANFSIDKIEELTKANEKLQVNDTQLSLFKLLASMTSSEPHDLLEQLAALDETKLAAADKKLLNRARGILGYIVAPIDEVSSKATHSVKPRENSDPSSPSPLEQQKVQQIRPDVSPSPSSSGTVQQELDQSDIDQFIGDMQSRLSEIDNLLSK